MRGYKNLEFRAARFEGESGGVGSGYDTNSTVAFHNCLTASLISLGSTQIEPDRTQNPDKTQIVAYHCTADKLVGKT